MFVALFDFESQEDGDLSFKKGDTLVVIDLHIKRNRKVGGGVGGRKDAGRRRKGRHCHKDETSQIGKGVGRGDKDGTAQRKEGTGKKGVRREGTGREGIGRDKA